MSTIMEKLDQEHGTNYWVMLDSLGGHPTEIINKYQAPPSVRRSSPVGSPRSPVRPC